MRRAFKYRLKPNVNQERELGTTLETLRRLYNEALEMKKTAWETEKKSVSFAELSRWFTEARKSNPWYAKLNRNTAQSTLKRLDKAFQAFFRRVKAKDAKAGYPRFKGRDRFASIEYLTPNNGYKLNDDRIYLQYIGDVKIRLHRPIEGKIKQVVVKREAGRWYVVFSCDLGEVAIPPSLNPPVGIDVGIESFLTTSDGEHVANPQPLKHALKELRRKQRIVSRKDEKAKAEKRNKFSSKRRRKAKQEVAKVHARVKNTRKEHHHKISLSLVRRFGLVAVESLSIKNMLKNDRLSRAISDAGWAGFLSTLRYKAEGAGVSFVEVDPRGTSQLCSGCGTEVRKDLSVRHHSCPHCGLSLHRDENAARNILARGLPGWTSPAGLNPGVGLDAPRSSPPSTECTSQIKDLAPSPGRSAESRRKPKPRKTVREKMTPSGCLNGLPALPDKDLRSDSANQPVATRTDALGSLKTAVQPLLWQEDEGRPCETSVESGG